MFLKSVFSGFLASLFLSGTEAGSMVSCIVDKFVTDGVATAATFSGDGGPASSAQVANPYGLWMNSVDDDIYFGDRDNAKIRKVSLSSTIISSFAGGVTSGSLGGGDGGPALSSNVVWKPWYITGDSTGVIYVIDQDNSRVRKITANGIISSYAGVGGNSISANTAASIQANGDAGAATSATYRTLSSGAVDSAGNLYLADGNNNKVRMVERSTALSKTVAGTGLTYASTDETITTLTASGFTRPFQVFVDSSANLYFTAYSTGQCRKTALGSGTFTIFTGNLGPTAGSSSGNGGPVTSAGFGNNLRVVLDTVGNIFLSASNAVRWVDNETMKVNQLASVPTNSGYSGNGGAASSARFRIINDILLKDNVIYVTDSNNAVRKLTYNYVSSTATTGSPTKSPSGQPSLLPTATPTITSSAGPTLSPSAQPTCAPSLVPSLLPSVVPSLASTLTPSVNPSVTPTDAPTNVPSLLPSVVPSLSFLPSYEPSLKPSLTPSVDPTVTPTDAPTLLPSLLPSVVPTPKPTMTPSVDPSVAPSCAPSLVPSLLPTMVPSQVPTLMPSVDPSMAPTDAPTLLPSLLPSVVPSLVPTVSPTAIPSMTPTSAIPTLTFAPSLSPTATPGPSKKPTTRPSVRPSRAGVTIAPTALPTVSPTLPIVVISFNSSIVLHNVTASTLDGTSQTAVTSSVATTLNISSNQVSYVSQTLIGGARRSRRRQLRVEQVYQILVTVNVVASTADFVVTVNQNGSYLYNMLTTVLTDAVESNVFARTVRETSATLGASATRYVGYVNLTVSDYTDVTPAAVTVARHHRESGLSAGAIAGIVIGGVAALMLMMCLCLRHNRKKQVVAVLA